MTYRKATPLDWPAIAEFLFGQPYFGPVDLTTIGGHWLIAEENDHVHATLWCFVEPPHAYIDYWASDHAMAAAKLGALGESYLRSHDVRYVHGLIHSDNESALRLATGLGMMAAGPYNRVFKEVGNGKHDD